MLTLPPLSLYVHLPWCERKCPYCDFNSHAIGRNLPQREYLDALELDMADSAALAGGRQIQSVYIGGGTPSLFSADAIGRLMHSLRRHFVLANDAEVSLESNPGSAEQTRFAGYREAGVNRLSLGIQSFHDTSLRALGRIHDGRQARAAVQAARSAGFTRMNLDLMYGLPDQTADMALDDLQQALDCATGHLSWYQLTVEPNTVFADAAPPLPTEETLNQIHQQGLAQFARAGLDRYEVSAYACDGERSRHNVNYWEFGDYLALGAGAHGKISSTDGRVQRYWKTRMPADYMDRGKQFTAGRRWLSAQELPLEFFMNALRLRDGVDAALFATRTGLDIALVEPQLRGLRRRNLLVENPARLQTTELGFRFLNEVLLGFDR